MPFLIEIDIRSNPVGDDGIIKLVQGIPNLRKFMISETGLTDRGGKAIVEGVRML